MIREGKPDDSEGIALVHVQSWQAAYRDLFPPQVLAGLSVEQRAQMWLGQIATGERAVLITEDEAVVQGFAAIGPSEESNGFGELYALYVEPSLWGRGVGSELCRRAEDALPAGGFSEAILWVWDNSRARRFYERGGWRADGRRTAEMLGVAVPEVRYRKQL